LAGYSARVVAIDERLVVHVVHHEIGRAVAVQVAVRRAVRETRPIDSPGRAHVGERQIPVVAEGVIAELGRGHRLDQAHEIGPLGATARGPEQCLIIREKRDVVL